MKTPRQRQALALTRQGLPIYPSPPRRVSTTFVERMLAKISPKLALERWGARLKFEGLSSGARSYDAADRGRRLQGLPAPWTSANIESYAALVLVRNRMRELTRNNPHAKRAVNVITNRVVGTGVHPRLDKDSELKKAWVDWSGTPACDVEGRRNFVQMQRLWMRSIAEAGEGLARRIFTLGSKIPLKLQMLEPDFIDESHDFLNLRLKNADPRSIQGVQIGEWGERLGYWLHKEHPGDRLANSWNIDLVPAMDVLHGFREDRIGQVRGIPWGAACVLRMADFDQYTDAELMRKKISTALVGFVRDIDAEPVNPDNLDKANSSDRVQDFEPGTYEYLSGGKTIEFNTPPTVEGVDEYASLTLREIATGFDISYEALSGDYSKVNFSSGRMGWIEFMSHVEEWQRDILIAQFCQPAWEWFLQAATLAGIDTSGAPLVQKWIPPRREMIDPVKETRALVLQVRAGFLPLSDALLSLGRDPGDTLEQIEKDLKMIDDHVGEGILEADPRTVVGGNAGAGLAGSGGGGGKAPPDTEDTAAAGPNATDGAGR